MINGRLDTARLDLLMKQAPHKANEAVRAVAFDVQAQATQKVSEMGAVDTGALMNSIYTVTYGESGLNEAIQAARSQNPRVYATDQTPGDPKLGTAYIAPAVEYAFFVEMGHERVAARPFLQQAMDIVPGRIKEELDRVFR